MALRRAGDDSGESVYCPPSPKRGDLGVHVTGVRDDKDTPRDTSEVSLVRSVVGSHPHRPPSGPETGVDGLRLLVVLRSS